MATNHKLEYWLECVQQSLDEQNVTGVLTDHQAYVLAQDIEAAHDCYGMAFPTPENPLRSEVSQLEKELAYEKSKIICPSCSGAGTLYMQGPHHRSSYECFKCNSRGWIPTVH